MNDFWDAIPGHCRPGLRNYIDYGLPVGGFLEALLKNNLADAVLSADYMNRQALLAYARLLRNCLPPEAWGSAEAYDAWLKRGGLKGKRR